MFLTRFKALHKIEDDFKKLAVSIMHWMPPKEATVKNVFDYWQDAFGMYESLLPYAVDIPNKSEYLLDTEKKKYEAFIYNISDAIETLTWDHIFAKHKDIKWGPVADKYDEFILDKPLNEQTMNIRNIDIFVHGLKHYIKQIEARRATDALGTKHSNSILELPLRKNDKNKNLRFTSDKVTSIGNEVNTTHNTHSNFPRTPRKPGKPNWTRNTRNRNVLAKLKQRKLEKRMQHQRKLNHFQRIQQQKQLKQQQDTMRVKDVTYEECYKPKFDCFGCGLPGHVIKHCKILQKRHKGWITSMARRSREERKKSNQRSDSTMAVFDNARKKKKRPRRKLNPNGRGKGKQNQVSTVTIVNENTRDDGSNTQNNSSNNSSTSSDDTTESKSNTDDSLFNKNTRILHQVSNIQRGNGTRIRRLGPRVTFTNKNTINKRAFTTKTARAQRSSAVTSNHL